MERKPDEPASKLATTAVTTALGGLLLWAVVNPFSSVATKDTRRDDADIRVREQIAEFREEYRGEIASLRADVESVKAVSKDRFSASDFEREDRRIEVELTQIKEEVRRLEGRIDRLVKYLAEGDDG
jgi:hypothetical protein